MASSIPPAAADAAATAHARRRLGKYEILRHIATGGMAEIHLARATGIEGFEKLCVIKQILPNLAENQEFVEMFLDEARLAATLHHSNVVQVYDIGSVGGVFFFSMEFLHGEDVGRINRASVARGEPFPLEHAVAMAIGACSGLHYAHDKCGMDGQPLNIVHRDVSPANVFITFDGGVKLLDFGIAKASLRHTETRVGTLKGKIRYMSPEQCRGDAIDRRSDIFSLCVMLWELTVGQRLFEGQTEFEVLEAIVHRDARPPSLLRPGYPPELERILLRGLRRKPAERYQSAEDLQIDLEAFARENKLVISSVALSRWVKGLFADKLAAWQRAQQEGKAFADFVVDAYGRGVDTSGSGRRDPDSGRRTRTETSGEPLKAPLGAASPPTTAGSPSSLLRMMAGAAPVAAAPLEVADEDLEIVEGTPIQEIPAPATTAPYARPADADADADATVAAPPDDAPDETVHDAFIGSPTVAAPFSSSDSIDAVDVANEFDEDRAQTRQTQSRYVTSAPAPSPSPSPRLRLGVIALVAVAFTIPAVGIVLWSSRGADSQPSVTVPGVAPVRTPEPSLPAAGSGSPVAAPERPALPPTSAPAVAEPVPAAPAPTARPEEIAPAAPAPTARPEEIVPAAPAPTARPEKPRPEKPAPTARPEKPRPAAPAEAARPPKPKAPAKPKAPSKPRRSGAELDPLLPP